MAATFYHNCLKEASEENRFLCCCGWTPARVGGREPLFLHQKQHHVPYSLAILLNGTFLLILRIASMLWAFQYVF